MSIAIIQEKLASYQCQTVLEEENALKEIAQEIALSALSRAGFFQRAAFQGGTCLRILYGLERFSEDLAFILDEPNRDFSWPVYLTNVKEEFRLYGYEMEVLDRSKVDNVIKKTFLKTNSLGGLLLLDSARSLQDKPKINIKLEIDVNPPSYSGYEVKYLDFPVQFNVKTQDLPSLFASKCHALLCRNYVKGRDWYDFSWYIAKQAGVNVEFLQSAIGQMGPWEGQDIVVNKEWLLSQLQKKIQDIDWNVAKQDVARFLRPRDLPTLDLWSKDFFMARLDKMRSYL